MLPIATQPVSSSLGMVVSPHTIASQAGREILQQGGNAVDAAIALQAALSVTYPHMTGLGGDAFWLVYDAKSRQLLGLNGSGRAAQAADLAFYGHPSGPLPQRGGRAALTVPGALDSWWQLHQRLGSLPWAKLLKPAIDLARGYPMSRSQAYWTRQDQELLAADAGAAATFLPGGHPPQVGDRVCNRDLARVLAAIAEQGAQEFYTGAIAQRLVAYLGERGSPLSLQDFADHRSTWVEPIFTDYRGDRVYQLPPNTQGLSVLQILNLIEPFDLARMGRDSADYYHLMVEATKLAFCDRDTWIGDPDFTDIPIERLISKAYARLRSARISFSVAQRYTATPLGGDTVYAAVADAQGNTVSTIQSLYFDYGCGLVPPGLGFAINNRGSLFATDPNHANVLQPGKRPLHTLIPAMVLSAQGTPRLVLGTMGGEGQPQTQVALLTRILDFDCDIQTAINLPRWRWGRTWGENSTRLALEGRIPTAVRQTLQDRGHTLQLLPDWTSEMGHAHAIQITPAGLLGACDPRSDGVAVGL